MATEKLIYVNEVKKKLVAVKKWFEGYPSTEQDQLAQAVVKMCLKEVKGIKPVDAVEVVRCCDCLHCIPWQQYADAEVILYCKKKRPAVVDPTDFCSRGERRTDNG